VVPAARMIGKFDQKPMKGWSVVGNLQLQPKAGSDLAKVLFAEFRWVQGDGK